jgi:hypothetical protein
LVTITDVKVGISFRSFLALGPTIHSRTFSRPRVVNVT